VECCSLSMVGSGPQPTAIRLHHGTTDRQPHSRPLRFCPNECLKNPVAIPWLTISLSAPDGLPMCISETRAPPIGARKRMSSRPAYPPGKLWCKKLDPPLRLLPFICYKQWTERVWLAGRGLCISRARSASNVKRRFSSSIAPATGLDSETPSRFLKGTFKARTSKASSFLNFLSFAFARPKSRVRSSGALPRRKAYPAAR